MSVGPPTVDFATISAGRLESFFKAAPTKHSTGGVKRKEPETKGKGGKGRAKK